MCSGHLLLVRTFTGHTFLLFSYLILHLPGSGHFCSTPSLQHLSAASGHRSCALTIEKYAKNAVACQWFADDFTQLLAFIKLSAVLVRVRNPFIITPGSFSKSLKAATCDNWDYPTP